jgi:hypothetical protein
VAATTFLCDTFAPATRGLQEIGFASYMEAKCPDLPIFIDTRFELVPTAQWYEYIDMNSGRSHWTIIADKYGMQYIFASLQDQSHLVDALSANADWQEIYRDDRAVIYQRSAD